MNERDRNQSEMTLTDEIEPSMRERVGKTLFYSGLIFASMRFISMFSGFQAETNQIVEDIFICSSFMLAGIGLEVFRKKE